MSGIDNRLRRLERARGAPCPECGDLPPRPELIVVWPPDDPLGNHTREMPKGEPFCPACGRERWIIMRVVYEGAEEGEGAE